MEEDRQPQSAVDWVIQNSKHKGSEYIVLVMLAKCIDGGNACPSHKNLADMTRLKKPTVQHALGELEKDGIIVSARNGGKTNNGGTTNCYTIKGYVKPTQVASEPTEVKHTQVVPDTPQVDENPPGSDIPQAGDTPLGETIPGQNVVAPAYTHTRAAGEKESVSLEKQELEIQKTKDRQTDSVGPTGRIEPDDDGLTPEQRQVRSGFETVFGWITIPALNELKGHLVFYGLSPIVVALTSGAAKIRRGETIRDPLGYIRTTLSNMALEGKIPHLATAYSQSAGTSRRSSQDEIEEGRTFMKFNGWGSPAPKGVTT